MLKKWLCLVLALAVCCAPVAALAEVSAQDVDVRALPADFAGDTGLMVEGDPAGEAPEGELPQPEEEEGTVEEAPEAGGEATSITLSATSLTIGVKEKTDCLTATLSPQGATNAVTWSTGNARIVKVNTKTGELTGVKVGSTTVTATTDNGLKKSCKVAVKAAPKKVTLNPSSLTLAVGQVFALSAELPGSTGSTLYYTSSKPKVATVEPDGTVTAVKTGSAKITVRTFNGKKATCKVKVLAEPQQVFLPEALTISEGEHKTIEATASGKRGAASTATYTYSAEDGTGSVTVNAATGEVVGVKAGTAFIRVTTHNGVSTHLEGGKAVETVCTVTVEPGPAKVALAAASVTIGLKQVYDLNPVVLSSEGEALEGAAFTVESSDAKKLTVNAKGQVKGVAKGKYTVTVTASNGVSAKCAVKVVDVPSKLTISPKALVLGQGQTGKLKITFPKNTMASCTFHSSKPSVAAVDGEGNVTGVALGTAVITVKTHNGKKASVTVTVTRGPSFIGLNADYELEYDPLTSAYSVIYTKTLNRGKTFQIAVDNEYLTYGDVAAYESLNEAVATVSGKGLVTAVASGTAIIVVRSTSGAEARLRVTVPGSPTPSIAFAVDALELAAGRTVEAPALTGENIDAEKLANARYSSGDTKVLSAYWDEEDARWLLRGVAPGTATLTATAGGATAQLEVTVTEAGSIGGIAFESGFIAMTAGETYAPDVLDDAGNPVDAALYTDNAAVANVDEQGRIAALAEGTATITATYQAFTATLRVKVSAGETQVGLDATALTLAAGQRHALSVTVDGEAASANLAFESSNASVATVNRRGVIVARSAGMTEIKVTASGGGSAVCAVTVVPAPTALSLEPASICMRLDEGGVQLQWAFGAPDEAGEVTFAAADKKVATVDEKGYVTFAGVGDTTVTARTDNGLTASVPVTVLPKRTASEATAYRIFAAYSYFDTSYSGYLPFPRNNAKSMTTVFGRSSIDGRKYSAKLMGNPSKTQLLSGIAGFFAGNGDNDVSIVFLCSHGQMDSDYTHYRLQLPGYDENKGNPNYFVSSREIMNCVERIPGRVVLIIDSCYSGSFLEDMTGELDALGGRIAVLTAASDTRASYYKVTSPTNAVDFFSYFLLQGLGYNEKEGTWNASASGGKGAYPGYLAADKTGNNDGAVTLGEFFDYAAKCIAVNIPSYMKEKWYWGDKTRVQVPRYYAGALNDLEIYRPGK